MPPNWPDVVLVDIALVTSAGLILPGCQQGRQLRRAGGHFDFSLGAVRRAGLLAASPGAVVLPKSDLSADAIARIVLSSGRVSAGS